MIEGYFQRRAQQTSFWVPLAPNGAGANLWAILMGGERPIDRSDPITDPITGSKEVGLLAQLAQTSIK